MQCLRFPRKILKKFNNIDGEEFNNEMISKIGFCHSKNWIAKRANATFSCVIINFWLCDNKSVNKESLNCGRLFSNCDRSYVTLFLKVCAAKIFNSRRAFVGSSLDNISLQIDQATVDLWNCSKN